jgi:fatty-acyl-CoA synthase
VALPTDADVGALGQLLEHSQAVGLLFQDNFWGWEVVNALDKVYGLCPELESAEPGGLASSRLPWLRHVVCTAQQGYRGIYTLDEVVDMGGQRPAEELGHAQRGVSPNDPFQIMYLTEDGSPLAPVLPHRMAAALVPIVADVLRLTSQDRLLLPPAFLPGFCAWVPLLAVYVGAAMEIPERWEPEAILKAVTAAQVTALVGDDGFFASLLDHPQSESYDLGSVNKGLVLGAPSNWQTVERLQRRGLGGLMNAYSRPEVGLVSATVPADGAEKIAATSGRVMPHCRVKVIDPASGQERPGGQEGEVCVQGIYPGMHMMPGYHHNPEATEQRVDKEGWFHTGDRGFVDGDGYLHIRGRV